MKKFDKWNNLKKTVHNFKGPAFVKKRQVRQVYLGQNIWFEEDDIGNYFERPVLVIKTVWNMVVVLPMTTKGKDSKYYHKLPFSQFNKSSRIILSQIRVLDVKRFIKLIWKIPTEEFSKIKEKLTELIL